MLTTDLLPAAQRDSRRLLIALHGLGDSMEGYRWLPGALNLPWLNILLVNAPDEYYGGWSWYDIVRDSAVGIGRSRKLLTDLLDRQRAAGFPSEQTILFGFSQGCLMTLETGLRYPHKLAGLVGISGYVSDPEKLLAELSPVALQQRALVTHGTDDRVIPFAMTREQINTLKAEGLHIEWHEFVKEHTIADEAELDVIREFIVRGFA
ncbi:MAG: serine esterase [Verrucomicrobia bacterium]|nr:serine esterase [Verrucomicrobiota bacterium]